MQKKWDPILAAAKRLFMDKGYTATSMDEVAERSGATKRTVYNNFTSKEGLLTAVIDTSIRLFCENVPTLPDDPTQADFQKFAERIIKTTTWKDSIGLQRFIVANGKDFPELAGRLTTECHGAITGPVRKHLESLGFPPEEAQATATMFIERATSFARLNRLMGMRPPYPDIKLGFRLDEKDMGAAVEAARFLTDIIREAEESVRQVAVHL